MISGAGTTTTHGIITTDAFVHDVLFTWLKIDHRLKTQ